MGNTPNETADRGYDALDALSQMTPVREADAGEFADNLGILREVVGTLCALARTATEQALKDRDSMVVSSLALQDAEALLALMPEIRDALQIKDTAAFQPTGHPTLSRRSYRLTAGMFNGTIVFSNTEAPPRLVATNSNTGRLDQIIELDENGLTVNGLQILPSVYGKLLKRINTPKRLYPLVWNDNMSIDDLPAFLRDMLEDTLEGDFSGVNVTRTVTGFRITIYGRSFNFPYPFPFSTR